MKYGVDNTTMKNMLKYSAQYDKLCRKCEFNDVTDCTECDSESAYLITFRNKKRRCHPNSNIIPFGFGKKVENETVNIFECE